MLTIKATQMTTMSITNLKDHLSPNLPIITGFVDKKLASQAEITITPTFEIMVNCKEGYKPQSLQGEPRPKNMINLEKGIFEEIQKKL